MAYNRKMRKFEGTCYIPGEQLAMMAKYYRGANLNLNLTLFEDDLSTLQETLDQACWCSKLDEVDRMKMSHMKGNEWRIAHEHCLQQTQPKPDGRNPEVYPALPQSSRSTVCKVERGTSAVSLYDRERGVVRGGRYRRDDYSEPRNMRDDYYDRQNRRTEYRDPRNHRGYYSDPRTVRDDYRIYDRQQNEKQTGWNMGGPPDQRCDMESEAAMSMPEAHGDIRCAVCNVETCLVCKNHLYSPICQCKCAVANAGLCNRCNQEPCEEEEQAAQETGETGSNKMDLSSMMLTMMMASMFKQSQTPESVCCCKLSRDNSDSSSDSSNGKVHKVYLYDCEDTKNNKKMQKKSKKASSESSLACDCCKCSREPKRSSGKKEKPSKTGDEETSESDADDKHQFTKGKGSKDSNRKSKGGESNLESDAKPKGSKESDRRSTSENQKASKSSKEDDKKSIGSGNMKSLKMKDENKTSMKTNKSKTQGAKAQGSIDSENVQFSSTQKRSLKKSPKSSSSGSDVSKQSQSQRKSSTAQRSEAQVSELLDTQHNVPDLESFNNNKKDRNIDKDGEDSSTTFSLKEFIVCLPKIQSNLQSLMNKLNQMDHLNNQWHYPGIDPSMANFPCRGMANTHQDVPLIASSQNPFPNTSDSLYHESPQQEYNNQPQDSEISIGFSRAAQHLPPSISKDEAKLRTPLNPPTRYHSIVNFSNLGETPEPLKVARATEGADSAYRTQSTFKFSPIVGDAATKDSSGKNRNWWPFKEGNYFDQNSPQVDEESEPITSKTYCRKLEYTKELRMHDNKVQPMSNTLSPGSVPYNTEIIELPDKSFNKGSIQSRKCGDEVHKGGTTATISSQCGGETIFQSYNPESSAETFEQNLTDFASFTDEKHFPLSQASSAHQTSNMKKKNTEEKPIIDASSDRTKVSPEQDDRSIRSNRERLKLHKTRCISKAPKRVSFKSKLRPLSSNPLSLEKLVHGCTVRGDHRSQGLKSNNVSMALKADFSGKPKKKLLDQGVGPGKFRRSKSDSSLDYPSGNTSKKNLAPLVRPKTPKTPNEKNKTLRSVTATSGGKHNEVIPLKKKRSISPAKEKARYAMAAKKESFQAKTDESSVQGNVTFKNIPSDGTADLSDSMLKMSEAYVRQELANRSYIVSSVEVKAVSNLGSSTDVLKMVQGIASNSLTNVRNLCSLQHQNAPMSSQDFDTLPLLPFSSEATTGESDTRNKNLSDALVEKKCVSIDDEVSPNAPAFLRKSRVQVEQLKRAHETIRSMIKNVNEVIAHIDSDSKIGIKSKAQREDVERQSYFVHLGNDDDKKHSHVKGHNTASDRKTVVWQEEVENTFKPFYSKDKQHREVQKMFSAVDRVLDSVFTPSDQSNTSPEDQWPLENPIPTRAHRDYFILNSDGSSAAFTESLRRSLENDTSRSVPLATQPIHLSTNGTSQRRRSTRPLKQRSWFPVPKK